MTTFTVWKFDDPDGAQRAAGLLKNAERDQLVKVLDHAVVSWPVGADRPDTSHSRDHVRHGAGWGALWGLVIGSLFLVPVATNLTEAERGVLLETFGG
jgi:uncharacterized membrane protein